MNSTVGVESTPRTRSAGAGRSRAAPRRSMAATPVAEPGGPGHPHRSLAAARSARVPVSVEAPSISAISALSAGEHPSRRRSDARHATPGSRSVPVANSTRARASAFVSVEGTAAASGGTRPGLWRAKGCPSAGAAASKSASHSSRSWLNSRLAGLTSPWTRPAACTRANAAAAAAPTARTSSSGNGPRSCSTSASEHAASARTSSPGAPPPRRGTTPPPCTAARR